LQINCNGGPSNFDAYIVPTNAPLASQRLTVIATNGTGTSSDSPYFVFSPAAIGVAINFTIRLGAPQMELGAGPTSPILPAVGTPAVTTRAADTITMPVTSIPSFNPTAMTVAVNGMTPFVYAGTQQGMALLDDGTNNNRITMRASGGVFNAALVVAGSSTAQGATANTVNSGVNFKFGTTVNPTGIVLCANGSTTASAAGASPTGLTTLRVGENAAGGGYFDGYIARLRYWPRTLSNSELQQVTT
jgi:hypothetical protein